MLKHIERLEYLQVVGLPDGIGRSLRQNRLLKLAREGGQMRAAELTKFEPLRIANGLSPPSFVTDLPSFSATPVTEDLNYVEWPTA